MSFNNVNGTLQIEQTRNYDEQGAAIYIAVILVWYSIGMALVLFLQMRPRTFHQHFVLDSPKILTKFKTNRNFLTNYRDVQQDNATKQILTELKDPQRRQKFWKIYFSTGEEENQPSSQYYQTITADSATIGRINRKLATIHRMEDTRQQDDFFSLFDGNSISETTKFFPRRQISTRRSIESSSPFARLNQTETNSTSATKLIQNRFQVEKVAQIEEPFSVGRGNPSI